MEDDDEEDEEDADVMYQHPGYDGLFPDISKFIEFTKLYRWDSRSAMGLGTR